MLTLSSGSETDSFHGKKTPDECLMITLWPSIVPRRIPNYIFGVRLVPLVRHLMIILAQIASIRSNLNYVLLY